MVANLPSVPDEPLPTLSVFNIGRTRSRQTNDGPHEAAQFLRCFVNALKSIQAQGYILQGAMYECGSQGATIFIDTDDEDWSDKVHIYEEYEVSISLNENSLSMADHPSVSGDPLPRVSVFNVGKTSLTKICHGPIEAHLLLQSVINALKSIEAKRYVVQGVSYGSEGANIFIHTDDGDEEWVTNIDV